LEALKSRISDHGLQPNDFAKLRQIFGDQPTAHAALAMTQLVAIAQKQGVQDDKAGSTTENELKKSLLDHLQAEIEMQEFREELSNNISARGAASDIQEPPRSELETLLRYRAANTRDFKDLLDSLERIRRLRRSAA
jgi:hypothetical protein